MTYDIGVQTYDRLSHMDIQPDTPYRENKTNNIEVETNPEQNETTTSNTKNQTNNVENKTKNYNYRNLALYYGTTNVKVSTTSKLIDFSTFISNVGGNLGLFVGFSVHGGFGFICDFIAAQCRRLNIF